MHCRAGDGDDDHIAVDGPVDQSIGETSNDDDSQVGVVKDTSKPLRIADRQSFGLMDGIGETQSQTGGCFRVVAELRAQLPNGGARDPAGDIQRGFDGLSATGLPLPLLPNRASVFSRAMS